MSVAKVLRMEDYRGKRAQRVRLSERLYGADPNRLVIFRHLTEVAELCDADRVATVWVDEYGPGSVHPQVVLDHLADRPRRVFPLEPLRKAWDLGVPAATDELHEPGSSAPTTFAISLGSDGMRAWFLVAESSGGRPPLPRPVRERVMFLAGECAAVLLHGELDRILPSEGTGEEAESFPGWAILKDLEGRESDEEAGRRIARRFVVGRLARSFIDEDLVTSPERMAEQVRRARAEMPLEWSPEDREVDAWHRVLDSLERGVHEGLADALMDLGDAVEQQGHQNGAMELYACAYEIAAAVRSARTAAEASRFTGGVLRRRADWKEAETSFKRARAIAEVAGLSDVVARSMVGLSMIRQDLGNMPAARSGLHDSLVVAEQSGDRDTIAMVHHALMGTEQLSGDVTASLRHGWVAAATYESTERRTRCMAGLAAALIDFGDLEAAEDAWSLVAMTSKDRYYLIYAHDALGHLAALRGDREGFERHTRTCDELGWEADVSFAKAEILYYRGLSHRALGDRERALEWLKRAVAFAEAHGYNRALFRSEEALTATAAETTSASKVAASSAPAVPAAPPELREGLRAMRQELVLAET